MIPVALLGLLKSKTTWKVAGVILIIAIVALGFWRYESLTKQNAILKSDLADTEEAWGQQIAETEEANRKSKVLNDILAKNEVKKLELQAELDKTLGDVRKAEEKVNEKFKSCLDTNVPDVYSSSLYGTYKTD